MIKILFVCHGDKRNDHNGIFYFCDIGQQLFNTFYSSLSNLNFRPLSEHVFSCLPADDFNATK